MNISKLSLFTLIAVSIIIACKSTQPVTQAPPAPKPVASNPSPYPGPFISAVPPEGTFAPGMEQLAAIQEKLPGTTMGMLKEGHNLYTGACKNCHEVFSIYRFTEKRWVQIIDSMAPKAKLSDSEKNSLIKYVYSMKATQPAGR